jgi:hypothetical protein
MWQAFLSALPREIGKYAAGVAFTLVLSAGFRMVVLINRRRMLRFFGISSSCPELGIYLSRLNVVATKGLEPITTGYQGPAVQNAELVGSVQARDLLKASRVAVLSRTMREWLGRRFISIAPVDPTIQVSPEMHHLDGLPIHQNVISLGSHVYNSLFRKHNEQSKYFEFRKNDVGERAILVKLGAHRGDYLTRKNGEREVGVIERVNDVSAKRSRFYCAGLGASATLGCVRYLTRNWETLFEENGLDEFALFLVFPNQPSNEETVVGPEDPVYVKRGTRPAWWMRWF